MGYESCCKKYSHYFSPELKEIFREQDVPIPYILEVLDEHCEDVECKHHIFNIMDQFRNVYMSGERRITQDLPWVLQCHRCACLLNLVDVDSELLPYPYIAQALGMSKPGIELIGQTGLSKLKQQCQKIQIDGGDADSYRPSDDVGDRCALVT